MTTYEQFPQTEAKAKILQAINEGIKESGINISPAVVPVIGKCVIETLFGVDNREAIREFATDCDEFDRKQREKAPAVDAVE